MLSFSISIVTYQPDIYEFATTLQSLYSSVYQLNKIYGPISCQLIVVDNSAQDTGLAAIVQRTCDKSPLLSAKVLAGHGNIGFGQGHNKALDETSTSATYHLILNPDVTLSPDCLLNAFRFMDSRTDVGALTPFAYGKDGKQQHLCKRYPSLFDLFTRGFAPSFLKHHLLQKKLARYDMREECGRTEIIDTIVIASGCFMFCRKKLLLELDGFSPKYFMYFEDFDLSLRISKRAKIAFVPSVQIRHMGGNASKKGEGHLRMFVQSALIFFRIHGWKIF